MANEQGNHIKAQTGKSASQPRLTSLYICPLPSKNCFTLRKMIRKGSRLVKKI